MQHPGRLLVDGPGPASAKNRPPRPDDLGLNKQIAKRRMQCVRGGGRQDHFRITRHLDLPAPAGVVGDGDAAQLDVVLGRNDDLGIGVEVVVTAAKLGSPFRKNRLEVFRLLERRMIRCRPEPAAGHVPDEAKRSPVVEGAVFAPACDGEVLPAAVSAAGIGDHQVVSAV